MLCISIDTLFSSLPYREYSLYNVTLVNLQFDKSVFNFCDLTQYTPNGVADLLKVHGLEPSTAQPQGNEAYINSTSSDNSTDTRTRWAAFYNEYDITEQCRGSDSTAIFELFWIQKSIKHIQQSGASSMVVVDEYYRSFAKFIVLPGVNLKLQSGRCQKCMALVSDVELT
jgi:hypothetical protein